MLFSLKDKKVLIIGGSYGMGLATAEAVLEAGGQVAIVFFSGVAAARPVKGYMMGASINGALNAVTRSLALDFGEQGVRVNTIACGLMDTPLNDVLHSHDKAERIARMAARLPTGRIGTAEEGAMGAMYLMCNGYVTAQTIGIDGGQQVMD